LGKIGPRVRALWWYRVAVDCVCCGPVLTVSRHLHPLCRFGTIQTPKLIGTIQQVGSAGAVGDHRFGPFCKTRSLAVSMSFPICYFSAPSFPLALPLPPPLIPVFRRVMIIVPGKRYLSQPRRGISSHLRRGPRTDGTHSGCMAPNGRHLTD
jgi:hypothetical protein